MTYGHCEVYIFEMWNLVVLQECEVDGSSSGVQENFRNRPEPLTEMHVVGDAY